MEALFTYWPFVVEIRRSAVDSHHKGPEMLSFDVWLVVILNKLLNKKARFGGTKRIMEA